MLINIYDIKLLLINKRWLFVINLNDHSAVEKWVDLLSKGKAVKYNEKKQTLERIGILGRFRLFFCRKAAKAIDQKVATVIGNELRRRFQENAGGENLEALTLLADSFYSSKRVRNNAPEETAILERYNIGVKRLFQGNEDAHYSHPTNLKFFDTQASARDPRLMGASQAYAESHPDFVEFLLNNNLYYQKMRTCASDAMDFAVNDAGEPMLPFVQRPADALEFDEASLQIDLLSWDQIKADLRARDLIKTEDSTLKTHHMTKWGLLEQHSYEWDRMTPITKIDPPAAPCFQIASYHPKDKLVPGIFDDQGHTGMVFVDKDGYVYSCGFYCHPDSYFYAALKAQKSALRSPDLYEARVDLNWQSIAGKKDKMNTGALPLRWNDGILQFNCEKDPAGEPCLAKILKTWEEAKRTREHIPNSDRIDAKVREIEDALSKDSKVSRIKELSDHLLGMVLQQGIIVEQMDENEKFATLMGRVQDLQDKTLRAMETDDWSNGALPYMLAENNCTHVSRYYFGQYAEVLLGMKKTPEILNTRPGQGERFLPPVKQSPFSRVKWIDISLKSALLGRVLRVLSLTPILSTAWLGRGKAGKGFTPRTSLKSCLKNVFKAHVSPQQVREEGMSEQFKIPSLTRKIMKWISRPSGMLPIYKN